MFCVYWCNTFHDGSMKSQCETFNENEMGLALARMEELRKLADGDGLHFITMSSENPNCVGKAGAAAVKNDYDWTKRRGHQPSSKYQKEFVEK